MGSVANRLNVRTRDYLFWRILKMLEVAMGWALRGSAEVVRGQEEKL